MPFRLSCKNVYLTYPQCNLSKEDLLNDLTALKPIQRYAICQEKHQDDSLHLHALICYDKKHESINERYYDVRGFHPNIQPCRNIKDVYNYIAKDGDYIHNFNPNKKARFNIDMEEAETKEEFLTLIKESDYQAFVINHEKILSYAEKLYARAKSPPLEYPPCTNLPQELMDWVGAFFTRPRPDRPKSLILIGGTRLGKTVWARSLGIHTYWNNSFQLDTWNDKADYTVLDDIEWQYVPAKKALFGGQREFTLSDKYRGKKTLKNGKPLIYLCNEDQDPFNLISEGEKDWYFNNCVRIFIKNKLY
jgi:Geminivirus Rep catalytic domain/Geminivirus rep protein central domain